MNNPNKDEIKYKISWGYNNQWSVVSNIAGVPRPQGNLPNFEYGLKKEAQDKLMDKYLSVGASAASTAYVDTGFSA